MAQPPTITPTLVTFGLVAFALLAAPTASAGTLEIRVGAEDPVGNVDHLVYVPDVAVVTAGDTVVWRSAADVPHTVTAWPPIPGGFDSSPDIDLEDMAREFGPGGFLLGGASFEHRFEETGTFRVHCKIHPAMTGTITVVNESGPGVSEGVVPIGAGSGSGEMSLNAFLPASITVKAGSTVLWTNLHPVEPHTVTHLPEVAEDGVEGPVLFDSSPVVGPLPEAFFGPTGTMMKSAANPVFSHTFPKAGTYTYACKLHPGMRGTIIVLEKVETPAPPVVTTKAVDAPSSPTPEEERAEGARTVPGPAALLAGVGVLGAALALRRR